LGLGIVAWLLADPVARRWLLSPWLWAGGLIAVGMFLPVFVWNAEHDWISFHRQFGRLAMHGITLRYLGEFVFCQFGLLNPILAFFGLLAGAPGFRERAETRGGPHPILLATMAPLRGYINIYAVHAPGP